MHDHVNKCRKTFDKIQHSFIIITLIKLGLEGNFLNLIKTTYKTTANIYNGEKLKSFSLISYKRQGYLFLPLLFNIILKILANAIRQEKKIKGTQIGKKDLKMSLFTLNMIFFVENRKQ